MDIILLPLLKTLHLFLKFYKDGLLIYAVLLIFESLGVVDTYNQIVFRIHTFFFALYEPILVPIREFLNKRIPIMLDLSILSLFLILYFLDDVIGGLIGRI